MTKADSFLSRRKLLVGMGAAATAAAAIEISPLGNNVATTTRNLVRSQPILSRLLLSLANAGYDEWLDQVGSTFLVGGGTRLKLIAVNAYPTLGERPAGFARDRAFLAKFDVQDGGTMAGDLIYTATHPQYGAFQLFLSASSDPALPQRMTALFN